MKVENLDTKKGEYDNEELALMGQILLKSEEIKAEPALYKTVEKYMKNEAGKVKSLGDIRRRANQIAMTPEPTKGA